MNNEERELKVICPGCHGSGKECEGDRIRGIAPRRCKGKGYILAQLWTGTEEENNGQ